MASKSQDGLEGVFINVSLETAEMLQEHLIHEKHRTDYEVVKRALIEISVATVEAISEWKEEYEDNDELDMKETHMPPLKEEGMTFITNLEDGEARLMKHKGKIYIVHPNFPPGEIKAEIFFDV